MDEYIEREAAIAIIEEKQKELCPVGMYSRHSVYGSDREKFDAWEEIIEALESIPAADVAAVRHGRCVKSEIPGEKFVCSECGGACWYYDYEGEVAQSRYCPNCGCRMDLEVANER